MTASSEAEPEREPICTWQVPLLDGASHQTIKGYAGEITTVVGANGSGKSALCAWLDQQAGVVTRRLIAHRRLWFEHAGPDLSPAQREQTGQNMESWKQQGNSRYLDHANSQRANIVLFDLLAMINSQNAQMVEMYKTASTQEEVSQTLGVPLLDRLNRILDSAGLGVELSLTDKQTFDAVNHRMNTRYPIFQMSDGEKSALLLAAEILVAPGGCVQIIDEPERHLHRSISAGLVDAVIVDRPDCHFIVMTHDLDLAATLTTKPGQTLALTSCSWTGLNPTGWDLIPVDPKGQLPESARLAILGGRRDLLFIEGEGHSLDTPMYQLLFPGWTLFATGGCEAVIRAVTGLRTSHEHHWIRAHGVVDGDGRDEQERQSLLTRGILSLPVSEVETLYYLDDVLRSVAAVQAQVTDKSAEVLHAAARDAALASMGTGETLDRLATGLAMSALRRMLVDQVPRKFDSQVDPIEISIPSPFPAIRALIGDLWAANDYDGLVKAVPIRDTGLRIQVATALGFRNIADYESAVRVRIRADAGLAAKLQGLIGPVPVGASAGSAD